MQRAERPCFQFIASFSCRNRLFEGKGKVWRSVKGRFNAVTLMGGNRPGAGISVPRGPLDVVTPLQTEGDRRALCGRVSVREDWACAGGGGAAWRVIQSV